MPEIRIPKSKDYRHMATATKPVVTKAPSYQDIMTLANALHALGKDATGQYDGLPFAYVSEIKEDVAVWQIVAGDGSVKNEIAPLWSPASFTIGNSDDGEFWYSLLWEWGADKAPEVSMSAEAQKVLGPSVKGLVV